MHVQTGRVLEDPVAGHELEAEHDSRGGDPAVGLMDLLGQGMAATTRLGTQRRAPVDERLARLDHVKVRKRPFQPPHAEVTPPGPHRAVAQFGHGHEGHDTGAPGDDLSSSLGVRRRTGIEQPAGDVGVDDDVGESSSLDHASASAEKNASHSSSDTSSKAKSSELSCGRESHKVSSSTVKRRRCGSSGRSTTDTSRSLRRPTDDGLRDGVVGAGEVSRRASVVERPDKERPDFVSRPESVVGRRYEDGGLGLDQPLVDVSRHRGVRGVLRKGLGDAVEERLDVDRLVGSERHPHADSDLHAGLVTRTVASSRNTAEIQRSPTAEATTDVGSDVVNSRMRLRLGRRAGVVALVVADLVLLACGVSALVTSDRAEPTREQTGGVFRAAAPPSTPASDDESALARLSGKAAHATTTDPSSRPEESRVEARPLVEPPKDGIYHVRTRSDSQDAPSHSDNVDSYRITTVSRSPDLVQRSAAADNGGDQHVEMSWRRDGLYLTAPQRDGLDCDPNELVLRLPLDLGTTWMRHHECRHENGLVSRLDTQNRVSGSGVWAFRGRDYFVWKIERVETNTSSFDGGQRLEPAERRGFALFAPALGQTVHMEHVGTSSYSNRSQTHFTDSYDLLNVDPE